LSALTNSLKLSIGDLLAKSLNFACFLYLAGVLGVATFGVLELASAVIAYFLFVADGGLELWAMRESARGIAPRELAGRVLSLRLLLASMAFGIILVALPIVPDYPSLRAVLVIFGITLFVQAVNLKWSVLGQEHMTQVCIGLFLVQAVFALGVFRLVHEPGDVLWVPALKLAADTVGAGYFASLFVRSYGRLPLGLSLRGTRQMLRPALTMGGTQVLGILSFNFDSVLLGLLIGPAAVAWYSAAYKPVTVALTVPLTYFMGLLPALTRTHRQDPAAFRDMLSRSLQVSSIVAVSLGVAGSFLAEPLVLFLFGESYLESVSALRVLSWSLVLVILRGSFRHGLLAAGKQGVDLRCAAWSTVINIALNIVLIPTHGLLGAAIATVIADLVWLALARHYVDRLVTSIKVLDFLAKPIVAALAMTVFLVMAPPLIWPVQAMLAMAVYGGVSVLLATRHERTAFLSLRSILVR
jgi:O-antigen/teichoic acid export membrane protein